MTEFLAFDLKNPSSILSCVYAARENARMIRDQISVEMWEAINELHLFLKNRSTSAVWKDGPNEFFGSIKQASHLFQGLTASTFSRSEGWEFIEFGKKPYAPGENGGIHGHVVYASTRPFDDPQLLLQRAEAVRLAGEGKPEAERKAAEKKALEIIDRAQAKFPNDPFPYYRRANLNLQYPELRKDVILDLTKAIEKRPAFWQARRDLARLRNQDGDSDEAIKQMSEAVKYNPDKDELRVQLVRDLLMLKRDQDASVVIESVIEKRRDDVGLLLNSGDLMREAGRNEPALGYYRRAYEISQQMGVVTRYIDLLHAINPPNLGEVDRVLVKLKPIVESEPALLMARAKQLIFRGVDREKLGDREGAKKLQADGIRDMVASLRLIHPDQPGLIMAWFGDIKRMLSKNEDVTKILKLVEDEKLVPGWTDFFRAGTLLEKPETQPEGTAMLEELVKKTPEQGMTDVLLRQAYIALQARYYQTHDCKNSLRVMEESLKKFPEDAFILNNYAYTLVNCGEDPAKAVPVAEHAVKSMLAMNRSSADVLDTMGWVYVRAKMADKAVLPLQAALAEAGNGPIRATVLMHIAELYILRGDKKGATERADQAAKSIEQFPAAAKATGQDVLLEQLRKTIAEMK